MEYLYHYTSLETLALILKNQTICFNNLLNVDDMEEAGTSDMGNFGKFVFVSCWTDDNEELIPLWNLYTPNMHGVRIRMPLFPFKKYHYEMGQCCFTEETDSYINYNDEVIKEKCSITANQPLLVKVEYTDDEEKLFPIIKTESYSGATDDYVNAKSLKDVKDKQPGVTYSFDKLGKYKRDNWRFQREWRYILTTAPMGLDAMYTPTFETQKECIRRLENKESGPSVQRIFLQIDSSAINELEVVFGPKMTEAEKIMAVALLEKYAPHSVYRDSKLMIK